MKRTVNLYEFRKAFEDCGRDDRFTWEALETMYNYYEELEKECGMEIELDPIAFCCEWTEYDLAEMYNDYGYIYTYEDWLEENKDIYTDEEIASGEAMDDFLDGNFIEKKMEQRTTVLKVTGTNTYLVMAF